VISPCLFGCWTRDKQKIVGRSLNSVDTCNVRRVLQGLPSKLDSYWAPLWKLGVHYLDLPYQAEKPLERSAKSHNLFYKIHFNIILFMPRSSKWSVPLRFSDHSNTYCLHIPVACYMSRPSHPACCDHYEARHDAVFFFLLSSEIQIFCSALFFVKYPQSVFSPQGERPVYTLG
jgi:hypothetical protein